MLSWLKRLRSKRKDTDEDADVQAARDALEALPADIAEARRRTSEIQEISRTLRSLGERNHFAPLIRDALGGRFR